MYRPGWLGGKSSQHGWKMVQLLLTTSALYVAADPASTLRIMLDGAQTVVTPRAPNAGSMPAYAKQLSDQEIADVTNYIRNSWGNAAPLVTPAQVAKARREK